jgi:hypothetical protein
VITLLRPLFRYSLTVDAYVLRIGGGRWGPILQPKVRDSPSTDVLLLLRQIDDDIWGRLPLMQGTDSIDGRPAFNGYGGAESNGHVHAPAEIEAQTGLESVEDMEASVAGGKGIMRPFRESNPCPKCGSAKATAQYHGPDVGQTGCDPGEHIHRDCSVCGYPWSDACIELVETQPLSGATIANGATIGRVLEVDEFVAGDAAQANGELSGPNPTRPLGLGWTSTAPLSTTRMQRDPPR